MSGAAETSFSSENQTLKVLESKRLSNLQSSISGNAKVQEVSAWKGFHAQPEVVDTKRSFGTFSSSTDGKIKFCHEISANFVKLSSGG